MYIGFDVIEEILARLPVRHVLRCKLLSKTCYAMIKSPSFVKKHLHLGGTNNNNNVIVVINSSKVCQLLPCPSYVYVPPCLSSETSGFFSLAGSSNGLLCGGIFSGSGRQLGPNHITLWNPSTREFGIIDRPRGVMDFDGDKPDYYHTCWGFGYDTASDDYKLVMISEDRVASYSRRNQRWKRIECPKLMKDYTHNGDRVGVLVKEKLCWLARPFVSYRYDDLAFLMSFDLGNDVFCMNVTLPEEFAHRITFSTKIFNFMESLAFSFANSSIEPVSYDIWMMDGDNCNSWSKRFSFKQCSRFVRPTRTSINGQLVLSKEGYENYKVFLYDPHSKEHKELSHGNLNPYYGDGGAWSFIESLVSI